MSRLLNALGSILGKEISEEVANEFQDEVDDFKKYLSDNRFIENIPNLELESYELKVSTPGQTLKKDFKTKIEHKKVSGVFVTHRTPTGGLMSNRNSMVGIQVDRNYVFTQGLFHYTLLEKTEGLTIYEVAWRTDIQILTSDVHIEYKDGNTVLADPYYVYVHFICLK